MIQGFLSSLILLAGCLISFFPGILDTAIARYQRFSSQSHPPAPDQPEHPEALHPFATDLSLTEGVRPVSCHSHNDYWRPYPLFSAVHAGCIGVEADVWLYDDELYVGHTTATLEPNRTFERLYVNPIVEILESRNAKNSTLRKDAERKGIQGPYGVFTTAPLQTLVLLVDFKMGGEETWPYVVDRLKPLRERGYLTYFNGTARVERPITVVATGNAPFHLISANASYRDVFYDAPLARLPSLSPEEREQLASPNLLNALKNNSLVAASGPPPTQPYHLTNSYYASTSFRKAVGITWSLHLTESQVDRIRAHVDAAHERGLLVRYWSAPSFPRSLRNSIWRTMIKEGVDMLNTDDLVAATTRDWGWKGKWAWRADEAKAVNGQTASANPDKEATSS